MSTSKELHAEADRLKREAWALERSEKCALLKVDLALIGDKLLQLTAADLSKVSNQIQEIKSNIGRAQQRSEHVVDYAAAAGSGCYE